MRLDVLSALKLAATRAAEGRHGDAVRIYTEVLQALPNHTEARRGLTLSQSPKARAMQLEADLKAERWQAVVNAAPTLEKDFPLAPVLPNAMAAALSRLQRTNEALLAFDRALALDAGFKPALINRVNALRLALRYEEGLTAAQAAVAGLPDDADAHAALGLCHTDLGQNDAALAAFDAALAANPKNLAAHDGLCELYEKRSDLEALGAQLDRAQAALGDIPRLRFRKGQYLARSGAAEAARDVLKTVPAAAITPEILAFEQGQVADALGDVAAATQAFQTMNAAVRAQGPLNTVEDNPFRLRIADTRAAMAAAEPVTWASDPDCPAPAFLVGFPRSGTTLLEAMLRGHPNALVAEEPPFVANLANGFPEGWTWDQLLALPADRAATMRGQYLAAFEAREGSIGIRQAIDRNPMNLAELPLIVRLFPQARIIVSLRHPCDCVLSGWMQNFAAAPHLNNFLDIEAAAQLYDQMMQHYLETLRLLSPAVLEVRYEDLVADPRATLSPALTHLGLEWDDNVLNFRDTALSRDRINTPSYRQVTRGLSDSSVDRWRAYADVLAPAMPHLEPWIEHWGYDT